MSRWDAYLNTGKRIIERYDGRLPLSAWIKDFFRQHKQMGSRDRKTVADLTYSFYRLGHSLPIADLNEKLLTALFLCHRSSNELLAHFKPGWNDAIQLLFPDKKVLLEQESSRFNTGSIFPWQNELSVEIVKDLFNQSHLQQPDLFLRIRPQQENIVSHKLTEAGISFKMITDHCITLANASKIDELLRIDEEVVIQDYNSQRTGGFFKLQAPNDLLTVWDCCSGSGGKSIMAYDLNPGIRLTVSDSRTSILQNLAYRFKKAGITKYDSFVTDLSGEKSPLPMARFDTIIADVPCSGSGTWARTPEQLYFFNPQKIKYYSDLQKQIVSKVIPSLNESGRLIYITCSVFRQENEDVVNFILENFSLKLEVMQVLGGYEMKADSMFVAVFGK